MQRWGVTGLLVEYEDMFPYSDEISEIACSNAYRLDKRKALAVIVFEWCFLFSYAEVKTLLDVAKQHDMIVIPLIQTFGHFEVRQITEISNAKIFLFNYLFIVCFET
jgi:hexosaminidase